MQKSKIGLIDESLRRNDAKTSVFNRDYVVGDGACEVLRLVKDKLVFLNNLS